MFFIRNQCTRNPCSKEALQWAAEDFVHDADFAAIFSG